MLVRFGLAVKSSMLTITFFNTQSGTIQLGSEFCIITVKKEQYKIERRYIDDWMKAGIIKISGDNTLEL